MAFSELQNTSDTETDEVSQLERKALSVLAHTRRACPACPC